jgi:glycosyltransferase involved in cell wall biosynthesis
MKILLVITKADIGGAQAFVLNLAKGLKEVGKDVSVAFGEGDYLPQELEKEGIRYYTLNNLKRSKNPLKLIYYIKELRDLVKKEGFDVIHLNSTNALPGAMATSLISKRIKTVFTVHGLSVLDKNYEASKVTKFIFRLYFKFLLIFIDETVFVSKYNKEEAEKMKIVKEGHVIYNGFSPKEDYFFYRDEARLELSRMIDQGLNNTYLIGSIGRLAYQKNYSYMINNWKKIKAVKNNAKLIIIGEGEKRDEYEKLIKEKNLEDDIFLPGEKKEASRLLKAFDLFVLPSIYEGLSIALIETQLASVKALASDVGGNREVIGEENCFSLNGTSDFLKKIEHEASFIDKKDEFRIDKMISEYIKVYE